MRWFAVGLGWNVLALRRQGSTGGDVVIPTAGASTLPLCVDLDGTLIRGDRLLESLTLLIKRNPLYLTVALAI
jgi:hypothetical protein